MVSVRVHSALIETVDILIKEGAAENRSEYFRRAYAEEVRRRRDVPQGYADIEARLLSGDAFKQAVIGVVKELLLEMFSPILHLLKM
jgi:metal-responsive CopG/Arc/MetJ family transcriptional regulator